MDAWSACQQEGLPSTLRNNETRRGHTGERLERRVERTEQFASKPPEGGNVARAHTTTLGSARRRGAACPLGQGPQSTDARCRWRMKQLPSSEQRTRPRMRSSTGQYSLSPADPQARPRQAAAPVSASARRPAPDEAPATQLPWPATRQRALGRPWPAPCGRSGGRRGRAGPCGPRAAEPV